MSNIVRNLFTRSIANRPALKIYLPSRNNFIKIKKFVKPPDCYKLTWLSKDETQKKNKRCDKTVCDWCNFSTKAPRVENIGTVLLHYLILWRKRSTLFRSPRIQSPTDFHDWNVGNRRDCVFVLNIILHRARVFVWNIWNMKPYNNDVSKQMATSANRIRYSWVLTLRNRRKVCDKFSTKRRVDHLLTRNHWWLLNDHGTTPVTKISTGLVNFD